MSDTYMPKRSRARRREGAPDYVCDVFDHPGFADRYTDFLTGADFATTRHHAAAQYLALSDPPTQPQGVSLWGEMAPHAFAAYR